MSAISRSELEELLIDPGASYRSPQDVIDDPRLKRDQRIEILCRWAYDATELAVADEEGMSGGESSDLNQVLDALDSLFPQYCASQGAPTKHAGFCHQH